LLANPIVCKQKIRVMAFNAKILLDKRRKKEDGSYPVIMRLIINRKSTSISLNKSVPEKAWDENNQCVKTGYKGMENVGRFNNFLLKKKTNALDTLLKLDAEGKLDTLPLREVKVIITGKKVKVTFFSYAEELIESMRREGKIGNARVYKETLNWIKKYAGDKDFPFEHITFSWLKKMESKYLAKGLSTLFECTTSHYSEYLQ